MQPSVLASLILCWAVCGTAQQQAAPNPTSPQAQPGSAISSASTFVIRGTVTSGKTPLPGVSISAANSLTGKKVLSSTDAGGHFEIVVPGRGKYVVRAELTAFAAATSEVVINPATPEQKVDLQLTLLSRVPKDAGNANGAAAAQLAGQLLGRGAQTLSVNNELAGQDVQGGGGGDAPLAGMNALAGTPDATNQSVSVSGQMGNTQDFGLRNMDDLRERLDEMRARGELPQGGGFGGPGGGGGFGGPGGVGGPMIILGGPGMLGGGGRNGRGGFNINKPHGNFYYSMGNAALDASPYSLSGAPGEKPDYSSNRFGGTIGGPLNIPHIYNGGLKTMFFGGYTGTRATTPYQVFSHVPTALERAGDFSQTTYTSGPNAGQPVELFDPTTGAPLGNNISALINPTAQGFLSYIPLPNQPGQQNFRFSDSADTSSDALFFRVIHNFGQAPTPFGGQGAQRGGGGRGGRRARNNISFGFNWQRNNGDQLRPFPTLHGTNTTEGLSWNGAWTATKGKLNNSLRVSYNSNRIRISNIFAGVTDVAESLGINSGINGVSPNPEDWGVPGLSFTNFSGLSDVMPQFRFDRTGQVGDTVFWNKGKHNIRFGGDYRRLWSDVHSSANPNGSFTFTGFATAQKVTSTTCPTGVTPPCTVSVQGTGYDFADFLLGLPQQTAIQYSQFTYNLYSNAYDFFIQDDWRARSNLTLDLGLRYEYLSPYHEDNNRLVNLDPAPGFTAVAPVFPGQVGPFGGFYPATLVNPDRNNFAPRVGIAWKPIGNKTVIRTGYGINYNLGQYRSMVQQLAYQPPFSTTQTNSATSFVPGALNFQCAFLGVGSQSAGCTLPSASTAITNNYGVEKNYRLGYVQMWNLNVQRELRPSLLLNVNYSGSKGTALDMVRAPNRGPDGLLIANVQPFLWETSQGFSILHAGSISLQKRMTNGFSLGGRYTYSKSIDNASSIGGGAVVVAQNDLDLAAERGLSSFDQRHKLTANFYYELPFGTGRHWMTNPGIVQKIIGDWTWSGDATLASGIPFTARIIGDFNSVAQGVSGSLRANYNGLPISVSDPTVLQWFNTAAFSIPAPGTFGDAGRNTIEGPGTILVDFALAKNFPIRDMMAFEVRAEASNVFNHANFTGIDTTVNSPTYGQVISVGSMRKMQILTRFRF